MTKAAFIILTLAGFASGAEMEVTDRLSVDGGAIFKSTVIVIGNVGVGKTTPSTTLDVNGTVTAASFSGLGTSLSGITASQVGAVANDGTVSPANLLPNGSFESWSNGTSSAPDGWELLNSAAVARSSTAKIGSYSALLTNPSGESRLVTRYGTALASYLPGRQITLSCWVKCATANAARISMNDGTNAHYSSYHTGDNTWQLLTVSMTVLNTTFASQELAELEINNAAAVYFDGAMLVEGSSVFAFSDKPLIAGANSDSTPVSFAGNVGIGTTSPVAKLDVGGTDSVKIPVGTTAQRPATPAAGMVRFNSSRGKMEFYNGTSWMGISGEGPFSATGGTESTITVGAVTYKVHTFTISGTLSCTGSGSVEVLVVAGGGGGGGYVYGGGGGAGGLVYSPAYAASGIISVSVGSGGSGIKSGSLLPGDDGTNSVFGTITATGGGGGGGAYTTTGRNGGSGGGGSGNNMGDNLGGAASPPGQGNAGGNGYPTTNYPGGGGGGKGAAGNNAPNGSTAGAGGNGESYNISGSYITYAGGGGGGTNGFGTAGAGGTGGGGAGATSSGGGIDGASNTGGGGGGNGGDGGSGIVIVRYPL